ncbi:ArsR/SmtB family transcription factor [Glutamicibacter arilaitensis]|uniref:ArsR/SmtB family transcription factor n=1 Tax=Glutamicibacter arilaitensis TaxID=256701 RepID=UPI0005A1B614|nr:metalloregulator ArsR/SmtB family transcription factor [Glutamicibacter arilaitensis]
MCVAIDEVFSALAEPTRRKIIEALKNEPKAVGTLVTELEISQPTVSKHLKVLREAELVSMTAAGQRRIYSIDTSALEDLVHWCADLVPVQAPSQELATTEAEADGQLAAAANPTTGQIGRRVGQGLEQVTGRAQEFFEKLPRFGRRR